MAPDRRGASRATASRCRPLASSTTQMRWLPSRIFSLSRGRVLRCSRLGLSPLLWIDVAAAFISGEPDPIRGKMLLQGSRMANNAREDGTYPPLDVLKPVADGLWVVDSGPLRVFGLTL